jgi:hypothetical protein
VPEFRELADLETALVPYLKGDSGLDGVVHGRVSSPKLPEGFKAEERVRFFRVGSSPVDPETDYVDRVVLQFDCYGLDGIKAYDVARKTLSAMKLAPKADLDGVVVTRVVRSLGPFWSPDPVTQIPRYHLDLVVTVHPKAPE